MIPLLMQTPEPGTRRVVLAGGSVTFKLSVPGGAVGKAWLRTTAGRLTARRGEIVRMVESGNGHPDVVWRDVPMVETAPGEFEIEFTESEIGVFEARAFFEPGDGGELWWPASLGNVSVKVTSAWTSRGLGIYAAMARLFQPGSMRGQAEHPGAPELEAAGYTVLPPSGTLREVGASLDHILGDLGFQIVLLLPIFPLPTTYARLGKLGSPFAPLDFFTVDPTLAEFDRVTTPLDQLREVIDGVHRRGGRLFIDIPINHTGWAARMLSLHPEWYERKSDGEFKSPGAWGVVWEDLVELQYEDRKLWQEMAQVFLHWCREGVDGFRCDAGYMIPTPVWEYITAKVRLEYPDTIFLLEGLGGPISKMEELLGAGGLDWAYSELFQNYDRNALEWYLPQALRQSEEHGLQVNFAETHDNLRLASHGETWARMRIALAALTAPQGAWGLTCGAEWYAQEKIDVHGMTSLNWSNPRHAIPMIHRLNSLLQSHPAFAGHVPLQLLTQVVGEAIVLLRGSETVVIANLRTQEPTEVRWLKAAWDVGENVTVLFNTEEESQPWPLYSDGAESVIRLAPGQVLCLGPAAPASSVPQSAPTQGLVTTWTWPQDLQREVPWLEGTPLVVRSTVPFDAHLCQNQRTQGVARAVRSGEQEWEMQFSETNLLAGPVELRLFMHEAAGSQRVTASLWRAVGLPDVQLSGPPRPGQCATLTNGRGAMCQVHAAWGCIESQYDSFFAANLHPQVPVDRRMLLGRWRIWINRRGFSTALESALVERFSFLSPDRAVWDFLVPCGEGLRLEIRVVLLISSHNHQTALRIERRGSEKIGGVKVIVRPDLEDRGFHEKSFFPPEIIAGWEASIRHAADGFARQRWDGGQFKIWSPDGSWHPETEVVGVGHAADAERGQGGHAELFSPGWFQAELPADGAAQFEAAVTENGARPVPLAIPEIVLQSSASLAETARASLRQFIVKRDDSLTIIAGYPWFLDWGRDTLICLRGAIADGWFRESREVLATFAKFERQGTLPNMIRGDDDSNRETVDAPLWFLVAVNDLLAAEKSDAFLQEKIGSRSILEILRSIAEHYLSGTENGIRVDAASGLVFSPSHFTWMDTNYPAGTPREGYPICVQAKWHAGLRLLARVDVAQSARWTALADQVRASVQRYFVRPDGGWLSDCLHVPGGRSAAEAQADDHLRPNQLLAITLGLVSDPATQRAVVAACSELVVPGALRTLADRPVTFALPISRHGQLLNHPLEPYWPYYSGDEDTRRKPAYHNGTAWPWLMPMLAEAMLITHGNAAALPARALLGTASRLGSTGSVGNWAEILDGAAPHLPKGCPAQAWSASELLRLAGRVSPP